MRSALAVIGAATIVRIVVACSSDYAGSDAPDAGASDSGADEADVSPLPDVAPGEDAACPARFMPPVGTYAFKNIFSGDTLSLNDASQETQPFDNPFFATITHEGATCFRLTAYLSNGGSGRHDHTWKFCNVCDRDAGSLDLVEETDRFEATSLGAKQSTSYTCARPNPYLVTDVAPDASIVQGACTGSGSGSQSNTLQVVPESYVFVGVEPVEYANTDASVSTYRFERTSHVIVSNSQSNEPDLEGYNFDVDSGFPVSIRIITHAVTTFGSATVAYRLTLGASLATPAVSPLIDP